MGENKLIKLINNEGLNAVADVAIAAVEIVFPGIGLATMASKAIMKIVTSRTKAYKNSLSDDIINKLSNLSDDDEFIQMFYLTYQSAVKAHNDEKASSFAKLMNGGYYQQIELDELFEFNEILNRLSIRDVKLLEALNVMPKGKDSSEEKYKDELIEWKKKLENDFDLNIQLIDSMYMRLQGYGLCRKWSHRQFMGQRFNEFWELTPYYSRFVHFIIDSGYN